MNSNAAAEQASDRSNRGTPSAARMESVRKILGIGGRALVAMLFVFAGVAKIVNPEPFLEHMREFHVPEFLLPAVILLELGAGLAILIGWRLREAAGALALFCVLAAAIFHYQLWIKPERTLFFKDLAIAGGLLLMAVNAAARTRARGAIPD